MPGALQNLDVKFPQFQGGERTDAKIEKIMSYLFQVVEQFRYGMGNIGDDNINLGDIDGLKFEVNKPVYTKIADAEGNLLSLAARADALALRLGNAEGDVSSLYVTAQLIDSKVSAVDGRVSEVIQTADVLMSRVQTAEGNLSTVTQTANSLTAQISSAQGDIGSLQLTSNNLTARISSAEGNVSSLQQTASSLTTRITNAEGSVSSLSQTASSLSSRISGAEGNVSALTQTVNSFSISVTNGASGSYLYLTRNGATISSPYISFSGMVTFSNLTDGSTTISGANIRTGTISAITLTGNTITGGTISGTTISGSIFQSVLTSVGTSGELDFYYMSVYPSYLAGDIRLNDQGFGADTARYRLMIETKNVLGVAFALKLLSAGDMSLESSGLIYMSALTYATLTAPTVNVGGPGQNVYLQGNVYVNGKLLT